MSSQERYEAPHGAFSRRLVSGCIPAGSLAKWGACARRFLYFKLTVARSACLWPPTVKVGKADDIVKQMARGGPRSPGSIPGRVLRQPCRCAVLRHQKNCSAFISTARQQATSSERSTFRASQRDNHFGNTHRMHRDDGICERALLSAKLGKRGGGGRCIVQDTAGALGTS